MLEASWNISGGLLGCTIEPNCALLSALLCSLVSVPLSAFKMAPKRLEIRAQTGFKSGLKSTLGPLAELLELSWQPGGLLEASWNALGALLEAFGAQKSNWKRLLDGPRPLRRLVSALPGGQIPSKRSPGGSQIEVRKRSKLKMAKP